MLITLIFCYRFGRKKTLLVSYITTAVFGFASAFSYNFFSFDVTRFFSGFGISGISIVSIVLCKSSWFYYVLEVDLAVRLLKLTSIPGQG